MRTGRVIALCGCLILVGSGAGAPPAARAGQFPPAPREEAFHQRVRQLVATVLDRGENKLAREDALAELTRILPVRLRVPILLEVLKADDRDTVEPIRPDNFGVGVQPGFVRFHVAQALMRLGPEARGAAPALLDRMLRDEVADVRVASALALARVAPDDDAAVRAFADALRSPDPALWQVAAFGLGEAGAKAADARPELERIASMAEPPGTDPASIAALNARVEARQALVKIRRALRQP